MGAPLDVIGLDEMTRTKHTGHWTREKGPGSRETWEGPADKAEIFYADRLNSNTIDDMDIDIEHGKGTVTITTSEATINGGTVNTLALNAVWELVGTELEKDIMQHPTFSEYDSGSAAGVKILRQVITEYERANYEYTPDVDEPTTLWNILNRGQTNYVRSIPILRQTIGVSRRTTTAVSWGGVDRAHSLTGGVWSPDPPTELIGAIIAMPDAHGNVLGPTETKQWLKRAPQVRQVGRHDYSEVQEWWFARAWSETFYAGDNPSGTNP